MSGNQKKFQQAMNQGHSAAWDQEWEKASQLYRQALEEFPENPMVLNNLGLALFELKRYDQALLYYMEASRIAPNDPLPPEKIGKIYERLGQLPEAIRSFMHAAEIHLKGRDAQKAIENYQKTISLDMDNIRARTRLSLILERMGRKEDAVSEYLAAASILQRSGDLIRAAQTVDHCLKILPENAEGRNAQELLQKRQLLPLPKISQGRTASLRMAEIRQFDTPVPATASSWKKPQEPLTEARQKCLVQLANLLFDATDDNGSPKPGLQNRRKPVDFEKVTIHLGQAIDAQTHGKDDEAIQELEKVCEAGLEHPALSFDLGTLWFKRDSRRAIRHLQQSQRNADYAIASSILLGKVYQKDKNLKEAASSFIRALCLADIQTVDPRYAEDLRKQYQPIIEAQLQQNDQKTLEHITTIVANQLLRPDWREFLKIARQQMPTQSQGSPPLPLADVLLESSSSQVIETIANIKDLSSQGMIGSALEEAYQALLLSPTFLPLHTLIAELLVKEDLVQEAMDKYVLTARLYHLRGETTQAIHLLRQVIQFSPMNLQVRNYLIELLVSANLMDEAIKETIDLARSYEYLADLEKMRQTLTDALRLCQEAKADRSVSLKILFQIADIDMQRLDWHQAIRVFEQIRTLQPDDPNARTRLVELNYRLGQDKIAFSEIESFTALLENSGKLAKAASFLENLVKAIPKKLILRKYLAELYTRNNQVSQAIQHLDTVAKTLFEEKDTAGAIDVLHRIISLNPPNMAEYQAVLAKIKGDS